METSLPGSSILYRPAHENQLIYQAKSLCHDVYLQSGYIKAPLPGGIIPYTLDASAIYIVALTDNNVVVGTIRLTIGCPHHIFKQWEGKLFDTHHLLIQDAIHGKSYEIGALAIKDSFSHTGVSFGLYKAAYDYSLLHGLDYAIVGIDMRALGSLVKYGWKFIQIGAPKEYYGSICVPAILPILRQTTYKYPAKGADTNTIYL